MRYFIGNLIRGEAAEYYKTTCSDLSARFGIEDVSTIVPPHITIKTPFERMSIETVDDALSLISEAPAIPFTLGGWDHFTNRTIFLDAPNPPEKMREYIKNVLTKMRTIGLMLTPQEQNTHIHMSIARFLKPEQYEQVWKYLNSISAPRFDIALDNLTIFVKEKREDKAWKILKTFPLTGK